MNGLFADTRENTGAKEKKCPDDYENLIQLLGSESYNEMITYHERWVSDCLVNGKNTRFDKWSKSITAGSKGSAEKVSSLMGLLAIGRKSINAGELYQLQLEAKPLIDFFKDSTGYLHVKTIETPVSWSSIISCSTVKQRPPQLIFLFASIIWLISSGSPK